MALSQMYVFQGIDLQVVLTDARKKSAEGNVLVHYHSKSIACQAFKHEQFANEIRIDTWGDIDGSATAPVREG